MLRTTNAAGRIRDESLMNLGGRVFKDTDLSFDVEDAQKEKYTSRAV
jgi:hypothetical protein